MSYRMPIKQGKLQIVIPYHVSLRAKAYKKGLFLKSLLKIISIFRKSRQQINKVGNNKCHKIIPFF